MKLAILPLTLPLRLLAAGTAFLTAFGYLFFLASQGAVMTLYAGTSIVALCYFAFCPRTFLGTSAGWVATVILTTVASVFALAQIYEDLTFFEGPELSAAAFRLLSIGMFAVLVCEARWRKKQGAGNYGA